MNYPGIMLATDHDPLPFSGQTLIANNGLYRTGGAFWNEDQEFGAITLFASSRDITGVTIRDTDIYDSTYDGIQFKTGGGNMPGVVISNVTDRQVQQRRRHPGHGRRPRQRDADERDHHQLGHRQHRDPAGIEFVITAS